MEELYRIFQSCNSVSIDTRTLEPGAVFFALTDTSNGHDYIEAAFEKGASFVVIDQPNRKINKQCFVVENTLIALQELAKYHRSNLMATVIAIAGSNGKTTVKNLVHRILESTYKTVSSPGNYNNHIGVPLTILSIPLDCEYAVIEMGANHSGEHAQLCSIAQPHYGLVTNCGQDHLEGYGSVSAVIQANCEVYDYLRQSQGVAIVNCDDDGLMKGVQGLPYVGYTQQRGFQPNVIVSGEQTAVYPTLKMVIQATWLGEKPKPITTHLLGHFQVNNVLAAIAIGRQFNVPFSLMQSAIDGYVPDNNRSQVITWKGNTVILDAYNANPTSMDAMIQYFSEYPSQQKVLILGDMVELGDFSHAEHQKIIKMVQLKSFDVVILVGKWFKRFKHELGCYHVDDSDQLKQLLIEQGLSNHCFLVKGSRRIGLETAFV